MLTKAVIVLALAAPLPQSSPQSQVQAKVERPTFKPRPPSVLLSGNAFSVHVWITPHPAIRTVLLEAWSDELVRSSWEPVNGAQRRYDFRWMPLPVGDYDLVGRVATSRGLTYSSVPHRLMVIQ